MLISIKRLYMANNKRYYHKKRANKPDNAVNSAIEQQSAQYSAEQLAMDISALGISESTCELLLKNRISTASDLVRRTDKDMYKVQGLNKKNLFEIKDALKANGMALRQEVQKQVKKPQNNADKAQNGEADGASKNAKSDKQAKQQNTQKSTSKFGLADRAQAKPQQNQKAQNAQNTKQQPQQKNQRQQKEKLTEPLPMGEWRKVMKGGKWGYSNGFKIVIPTMYDEIFAFKEGLASVEIDEKCGYIDEENNVVIPLDYDTAMSFSEGYAMVCKGDKCGYIDKDNVVVIPFEYDAGTPFEGGEAKVKKDGKWGTIDKTGKIVWI